MKVGVVTRKVWKCDVCNHQWLSRDNKEPKRCARCKTPYWNEGKKKKK